MRFVAVCLCQAAIFFDRMSRANKSPLGAISVQNDSDLEYTQAKRLRFVDVNMPEYDFFRFPETSRRTGDQNSHSLAPSLENHRQVRQFVFS